MKKFLAGLSIGILTPFVVAKGMEMYDDYQLKKAIDESEARLAALRAASGKDSEDDCDECKIPSENIGR